MTFLSNANQRVFCGESRRFGAVYNGEVLPFATFAACRLLRVFPDTPQKGPYYGGLFKIARSYIDADIQGICNCITRYKMESLVSDIAEAPCAHLHDMQLFKDLMLLVEKLLLEYLSESWDLIDLIVQANKEADMQRVKSQALLRSRTSSSQALCGRERACRNWQRAYRAAIRKLVLDHCSIKRKAVTMIQVLTELNRGTSPKYEAGVDVKWQRAPILLLLGGGMAAGKSTVRQIIGSDTFWSKVGQDAVVVEADAIKNQDVVSIALKEKFGDDPDIDRFAHEYSTTAAEMMLVTAINEQKDIIFDGTMTWLPFVEQTIAMARDHKHNYKRGPGYYHDASGKVHEKYWVIDHGAKFDPGSKVPYKIELVGVTCDPALAVARGVWRKIRTGRGVPINSQLRSHRLFSQNFEAMAKLVDSATLYHTGNNLTTFTHSEQDIIAPKVMHVVIRSFAEKFLVLFSRSFVT